MTVYLSNFLLQPLNQMITNLTPLISTLSITVSHDQLMNTEEELAQLIHQICF